MVWPFGKRRTYTQAYNLLADAREDVRTFKNLNKQLDYFYSLLWDLMKDEYSYYQRPREAEWVLRLALKFKRFIKEFRNFLSEDRLYILLTNPPLDREGKIFTVDGRIKQYLDKLFSKEEFFKSVNEESIKKVYIQNEVLNFIASMLRGHAELKFILDNCRRAIRYEQSTSDMSITKKLEGYGFEQQRY